MPLTQARALGSPPTVRARPAVDQRLPPTAARAAPLVVTSVAHSVATEWPISTCRSSKSTPIKDLRPTHSVAKNRSATEHDEIRLQLASKETPEREPRA